jgi:hypothetical protein
MTSHNKANSPVDKQLVVVQCINHSFIIFTVIVPYGLLGGISPAITPAKSFTTNREQELSGGLAIV